MDKYPLLRKGLVVGIILLFVGTCLIPVTAQNAEKPSLPTSKGNWLYVGGSGPGNYTRIQNAIDNASNGDTVFVYNGIYYENLVINKRISLVGENKDSTIIDGNWYEPVIQIKYLYTQNETVIKGFTVRHGMGHGIFSVENINVNIIDNNIVDNYGEGIYLDEAAICNISYNVINNNHKDGIYIYTGGTTNITNNIITNNYNGIHLYQSSDDFIINNTISNNIAGGFLDFCWDVVLDSNLITYNDLFGCRIHYGITCTVSNNIISYNKDYAIMVDLSYYTEIVGNIFLENFVGVGLSDSKKNIIHYNTFKNNTGYKAYNVWFDGIGIYDSCYLNKINYNNLINDDISFVEYQPHANEINYNYYNSWKWLLPKPILGRKVIVVNPNSEILIPWVTFDWHPAKEPYDIPGMS